MKNLFTILLFLFAFVVSSQNYKITYSFSLNIDADTIKNADRRNYYKNYFPEHAKNTFGVLWVNDKGTFFEQEGDLKNEYYKEKYIAEYYSSKSEKKVYYEIIKILEATVNYRYTLFSDFKWQIEKESKIINGYTCFKAIGTLFNINGSKQIFTAWFCPEIALAYGPDTYAGLPGLIFEVYRNDGFGEHWKLKSIENNKTKIFNIPNPNDAEHYLVTFKRYENLLKKFSK